MRKAIQLPNTKAGVQVLVEKLQPLAPSLVVAESTGGLERLLVSGLQEASLPVAITQCLALRDRFRESQNG